jgi:predicted DsbA family dithiol-disulfide isomerase
LHWAQSQVGLTAQYLLKRELLTAYFTLNEDLDDSEVLLRAVQRAGLNESLAKEVIESDQFTNEVKEAMAYYRTIGITAVPSVIVDGKYLIQGGQSAEVFANSLRQIAAEQTSEIQE